MYISGRILPERLAALINTPLFTCGALASGDTLLELILRSTMQAVGSTAASLFLADETLQNARTIAYICDDAFYCIDAKRALPAIRPIRKAALPQTVWMKLLIRHRDLLQYRYV